MTKEKPLSAGEVELLFEVLEKRRPDLINVLFERAKSNALERGERQVLCELLGAEFAETGMDAESEPLPRGMKLEALLDAINRPNLRP